MKNYIYSMKNIVNSSDLGGRNSGIYDLGW